VTAWFGSSWGAPVNAGPHVGTPVGALCSWCVEAIEDGDSGVLMPHIDLDPDGRPVGTVRPLHRNCHLRSVVGSLAHVEERCGCYTGCFNDTDPPEMTRRQAADAAVAAFYAKYQESP
jgi:hypothetical protein